MASGLTSVYINCQETIPSHSLARTQRYRRCETSTYQQSHGRLCADRKGAAKPRGPAQREHEAFWEEHHEWKSQQPARTFWSPLFRSGNLLLDLHWHHYQLRDLGCLLCGDSHLSPADQSRCCTRPFIGTLIATGSHDSLFKSSLPRATCEGGSRMVRSVWCVAVKHYFCSVIRMKYFAPRKSIDIQPEFL